MSRSPSHPKRLGGMEILAKLSTGGMGEVLLARRMGLHGFEKLIVLKTIRSEMTARDDIRKMFLDEARIMCRLDHAAVAHVYDFGEDDDTLYLAMEYVAGVALSHLLAVGKAPLPVPVAVRIVADVCRGLHAVHELSDREGRPLGIVHRDISPQNVILTFDGRIKIVDFGIALVRDREAPVTQVGLLRGKLAYMAPEQIMAGRVDRRTDVYSASIVLHELLTGRKLFADRSSVRSAIASVGWPSIPAPSSSSAHVSSHLDAVVLRGLAYDPVDRFQDARAMAIELERTIPDATAEAVAAYVDRELAAAKEEQRARLAALLGSEEAPSAIVRGPVGRATGAADSGRLGDPEVQAQTVTDGSLASSGQGEGRSTALHRNEPRSDPSMANARSVRDARVRPRAWVGLAIMAVTLATAVGAVAWLARGRSEVDPPTERSRARATGVGGRAWARAAEEGVDRAVSGAAPIVRRGEAVGGEAGASANASGALSASAKAAGARGGAAEKAEAPGDTGGAISKGEASGESLEGPLRRQRVRGRNTGSGRRPPSGDGATASSGDSRVSPAWGEPAPGLLTIGADPYAIVVIDGKEVGFTPIVERRLSAGRHEIGLLDPISREVRMKRSVELNPGQRLILGAP